MAEPIRHSHRHEWFVDPRSPDRRMRVTWHLDERLAIVSFWHRSTCTATFRLPAHDTARLIGMLADGLAEGWQPHPPATTGVRIGAFRRLRRWLSRHSPSAATFTLINGAK